jgi:hypothetical protein
VWGGEYRGQWEVPGYLSISIISRWVEEIYRAGVKPVLSRRYEKINYSRRFRIDFLFFGIFFLLNGLSSYWWKRRQLFLPVLRLQNEPLTLLNLLEVNSDFASSKKLVHRSKLA